MRIGTLKKVIAKLADDDRVELLLDGRYVSCQRATIEEVDFEPYEHRIVLDSGILDQSMGEVDDGAEGAKP